MNRLALTVLLGVCAIGAQADVAFDRADNDPYPVTGFMPGDNGGAGFQPWVELEEGTPGSMFLAADIDSGTYAWGLSGTYALGRGLSSPWSAGLWTLLAVHDPDNTDFSGFSLRDNTDPGTGFGDHELLRFGLNPNEIGYDATGIYVSTNAGADYTFLDCGWVDGEGDVIEYGVSWNGAGQYTLVVSNRDEGVRSTFVGDMRAGSVAMLGTAVFGATADEGLTFDRMQVIPEPATLVLLALGAVALSARRQT